MFRSRVYAALAAAVLLAAPAATAAQDSTTARGPHVRPFCFNGSPRSKCATFLVVEMQGVMNLVQTSRRVHWFNDQVIEERLFEDQLQWEVGLMHNVSERWAVGGAARLGPGSTGALTGLTARGRRWMSDAVAVDVAAGVTFLEMATPGWYGRKTGFVGDARLNFNDDAYVGLRFEQLPVQAVLGPEGTFDPGGEQRALSLLLGVGSEWAVGGSAAVGLGLLWLLATVDWS